MSVRELDERVKLYLESKFSRTIFQRRYDDETISYHIRGIKPALWHQVVKPELIRLAEEYGHALIMHVEKPSNQYLCFEFTALRAPLPTPSKGEPPLTDSELRRVRSCIFGRRDPGPER